MLIYHYHPETGAYLGTSSADPSPLEPEVFLIPAHATPLARPPVVAGYVLRFTDGAWGYSPEGDPAASPAPEPVVTPSMVNAERDRRINAGVTFEGVIYDTDQAARENISGAATAALAAIMVGTAPGDYHWHGGPAPFAWIAKDNTTHLMDAQTMFAFGKAAMAHKQRLIFAARALKDVSPVPADFATNSNYW